MHSVIHTSKHVLAERRSSERRSNYFFQCKYERTVAAELCLVKNLGFKGNTVKLLSQSIPNTSRHVAFFLSLPFPWGKASAV